MILKDHDIFHVHTSRCGHAELVSDESYVIEALDLGASGIWFTDHAPFPGNPFRSRMKFSELEYYLESLLRLKQKYNGYVHIGLEAEYFPSYDQSGYYRKLSQDPRIECMLLGQHMAEAGEDEYSFSWSDEKLNAEEYKALGNAIVCGINSGYFHAVAHPDRIFRRCRTWTEDMSDLSRSIVECAMRKAVPLEINISSMKNAHQYWPEFWKIAEEAKQITGLDAHSIDEMRRNYSYQNELLQKMQQLDSRASEHREIVEEYLADHSPSTISTDIPFNLRGYSAYIDKHNIHSPEEIPDDVLATFFRDESKQ